MDRLRRIGLLCGTAFLLVAFSLPAAASGVNVAPRPSPSVGRIGTLVSVTVSVTDDAGGGIERSNVAVAVTAGPHASDDLDGDPATLPGFVGACRTGGAGRCSVSYRGTKAGADTVTAWFDANGDHLLSPGEPSGSGTARWVREFVGGAISVRSSRPAVTYGGALRFTGTLTADAPCRAGRSVQLLRRRAGARTWGRLGTDSTADGGGYAFAVRPTATASYRVMAERVYPSDVACSRVVSRSVSEPVRARVTFSLAAPSVRAGDCVHASTSVSPPAPGSHVALQRRVSQGWRTIRTLTLDGDSRAGTRLCYGWGWFGTLHLRARWSSRNASVAAGTSPVRSLQVVEAPWMRRIDSVTRGRAVGVAVRANDRMLYARSQGSWFVPASNEKLLLSMALLDRFGPGARIDTEAAAPSLQGGVVGGNLWILGHGDPSVGPAKLAALAHAIKSAGVRRVRGRVMGSTGYFRHDWFAPGWKKFFPREEVGLPSALTFSENHINGRNVPDPERYAAQALTKRLRAIGVAVRGRPGSGRAPADLTTVATVRSPGLGRLITHMDHESDNFFAEVLGKVLGAVAAGVPGTIAKGAAAISAWTRAHGAPVVARDSSGLSYANRATAAGVTLLLQKAEHASWARALMVALAEPGEGTLEHRLHGVNVHAKTGTLEDISALSGWVWLSRLKTWAEFSILSRGLSYTTAKDMEDAIVRTVARYAH